MKSLREIRVFIIIFVAFSGLVGSVWGYRFIQEKRQEAQKEEQKKQARIVRVEAVYAREGSLKEKIKSAGTLKANESITIRSLTEGVVKEIFYEGGSFVEADTIIMTLDDVRQKAQILEAKASFEAAKSAYERGKELFQKKYLPQKEYDKYFAEYQIAQAKLEVAKVNMEYTKIKAPFGGVLGLRHVSPGELIKQGTELMTLDDLDPIKVEFQIPESKSKYTSIGKPIEVYLSSQDSEPRRAVISSIDSRFDNIGHNLLVRAVLSNHDDSLRPGQFVSVISQGEAHDRAIILPDAAVQSKGAIEYVFVVQNNTAQQKQVKTGRSDGGKIEILQGLSVGDFVIVTNQNMLGPNVPVVVVKSSQSVSDDEEEGSSQKELDVQVKTNVKA